MSGTSLDGLDVALCEFDKKKSTYSYKIIKAETINYSQEQKNKLKFAHELSPELYFKLHHLYGKFIAKEVNRFLNNTSVKPIAIASHGHTVFHQPNNGFTSQIGCGATIAAHTGYTTVCDFRSMDVALKGQGAPLVPAGDALLFSEYESCLNIGGIANISFNNDKNKRVAFDICIANMALNYFAGELNLEYDVNGETARSGNLNESLLAQLNQLAFYKKRGAKSLSREDFEKDILPFAKYNGLETKDILHTLAHHICMQISDVLHKNNIKNTFVTGGGAHNTYLMNLLKSYYKGNTIIPDDLTINFKEALIFAFLGLLRINEQINTLSSVTGAKLDSIGGAIYLNKL